ncbi:fibronectin type III domain-containing protein [Candidatus Gottesmanbacteria bacterium]|nr:fibronectin type III domain-containing protein [Candidatus Gottesmanbacteria bacterium]
MYRKERKLPTLIALFLLCLGFGGIIYLDKQIPQTITSAKSAILPQEIHFTNISDSSLTVSWVTEKAEKGSAQIKVGEKTFTYFDVSDVDNISRARTTHYITFKSLNESTPYTVKIISGDPRCDPKEVCPSFEKSTAKKITPSTNLSPVRGTIVTPDNQPVDGSIVYLVIGQSLPLSGRTDTSGLWVISLQNLLMTNTETRLEPKDTDPVEITAILTPEKKTTLTTTFKAIRENGIIPVMMIGRSYNFPNSLGLEEGNSSTNTTLGASDEKLPQPSGNGNIQLYFPVKESETTTDTNPRFRGTGLKGTQLLITVNSTPQTAKITVGNDGTWSWRPPKSLPPGEHYISVEGYDERGKLISVKRKFIVLKSGESVLGEATSSATLTPSPIPTDSPTPTPTIFTTPSPSLSLTPTQTLTPTALPKVEPPPTGSWQYLGILLVLGTTLTAFGVLLLL